MKEVRMLGDAVNSEAGEGSGDRRFGGEGVE